MWWNWNRGRNIVCFGGEGITTKIKVLVLNAVSMFLQKSGLGRQILLSRTCPGKKFCHRNNYYYYLGVTYYCTSSLLSLIIPSTEFPSATHDYFNRGCKVFKRVVTNINFPLSVTWCLFVCIFFFSFHGQIQLHNDDSLQLFLT